MTQFKGISKIKTSRLLNKISRLFSNTADAQQLVIHLLKEVRAKIF